MAKFEYEFSEQDRQLTISEGVATFGDNPYDYIRLTIYPTRAIDNIVKLADESRAIFFSSEESQPFEVNISPFESRLNEITPKIIGGNVNFDKGGDFKIYRNSDSSIYIKPNEIFNTFELPQGDYKIQIDFLNQLRDFSNQGEYMALYSISFSFAHIFGHNSGMQLVDKFGFETAWNIMTIIAFIGVIILYILMRVLKNEKQLKSL